MPSSIATPALMTTRDPASSDRPTRKTAAATPSPAPTGHVYGYARRRYAAGAAGRP